MKTAKLIAKILVAAAAVAGVVYVIATYGSQIVAWCKKLLASLPCCKEEACEACEVEAAEETAEEVAEEVVEAVEEVPAAEEVVAEEADVAEDKDFEA